MAVIEVENLVKTYGNRNVVDGVSFAVESGEIFGIVGPNGAGKTTIVESVEGLRRPDGGSIRVFGLEPITDRLELTQRVGAQLQESRLQDKVRVGEVLDTYASFYQSPADWRELLARFGLEGKETARYRDLSGGQKQRLSAALALVGSPEIAVLDELTTGLDPAARRSTWETVERIRDSGVTVVLVTHFMDEAERLCDRIMVVVEGRVVAIETPTDLIGRAGFENTLRFHPSAPIPEETLSRIPEVTSVRHSGPQMVVSGTGDVVYSVVLALAQAEVVAKNLQIEQASLEDAYLELTGTTSEEGDED
jgi:ABC-2 type transport system ATP-binding protein